MATDRPDSKGLPIRIQALGITAISIMGRDIRGVRVRTRMMYDK